MWLAAADAMHEMVAAAAGLQGSGLQVASCEVSRHGEANDNRTQESQVKLVSCLALDLCSHAALFTSAELILPY
jgi:hypothetical protein